MLGGYLATVLGRGGSIANHQPTPYNPGPVTIGDLRRDGKALEIGCMNCNRHGYFDANTLALPDALPVPNTANRLKCSRCGFRNTSTSVKAWARPDA